MGPPDAAIASLGRWMAAPSLLEVTADDLQRAIDGNLVGHFVAAKTFLPGLKERGGSFLFINGPLAFEPRKESGAGFISIATAGQQMLFRALARELEDSPRPRGRIGHPRRACYLRRTLCGFVEEAAGKPEKLLHGWSGGPEMTPSRGM